MDVKESISSKTNLERLKSVHLQAIRECREEIDRWNKFKADYEAVQSRLAVLPQELRYDIMVPLGRYAFMPGQLVHTNEVLVSLGDNWFAHCSAQQAVDIIGRRLQYVMEQLAKLVSQLKDLEARATFASDINQTLEEGYVEIREEYPEEEQNDSSVRRSRHKIRHPKQEPCGQKDHIDVMSCLDELENAEKQSEEKHETQEQKADCLHNKSALQSDSERNSGNSGTSGREQTSRACSVITFQHTPAVNQTNQCSTPTDEVACNLTPGNIVSLHSTQTQKPKQSPANFSADEHLPSHKVKHVRFSDDLTSKVTEDLSGKAKAVKTNRLPFSGVVVEKQTSNSKERGTKQPARKSAFQQSRQAKDS